jgi:hypothetical protein
MDCGLREEGIEGDEDWVWVRFVSMRADLRWMVRRGGSWGQDGGAGAEAPPRSPPSSFLQHGRGRSWQMHARVCHHLYARGMTSPASTADVRQTRVLRPRGLIGSHRARLFHTSAHTPVPGGPKMT